MSELEQQEKKKRKRRKKNKWKWKKKDEKPVMTCMLPKWGYFDWGYFDQGHVDLDSCKGVIWMKRTKNLNKWVVIPIAVDSDIVLENSENRKAKTRNLHEKNVWMRPSKTPHDGVYFRQSGKRSLMRYAFQCYLLRFING